MEENKKNKIPNVPNLRFPFFATQWIKIKVGDYYDVQMCRRIFANQTNKFGDVPFYKIGTLGNNADAYISKELFEEYKKKYNYPIIGETLITCSGTVGRCVQFDGKPSYYQDSNIVWLRKKSDLIVNDFLFRLIQQKDWSKLNTTTISRIYNADLLSLKFYIPASNKEQEKISSFLDLIDERIETQNKIIEKYESLIKPLFETLNSNANIDIAIKELGHYVSADLLSWNDMNDTGEPAIIYGQLFTDYNYIIDKVISKTERRIKTKTKDNDLLFPSSTTVDSLSLVAPSSIKIPGVLIGGDMFKIELDKDKFDSDYMSFLINCSLNKKIAKYAQGSTIIHLHYEDIKLFRMKICDIEKQKEISKQMKVLLEKISVERSVIELLQKQKKYFLDNLFI